MSDRTPVRTLDAPPAVPTAPAAPSTPIDAIAAATAEWPVSPTPDECLAEAAMHRILRRTLPAQRHEVLGALSALKLQLAVARRRAALAQSASGAAPVGSPSPIPLDDMAEQLAQAQTALVSLRLWDGQSAQRQPLSTVLDQAVDWVRQAAAMRGHRLEDASLACDSPDGDVHHRAQASADRPATPMVDVPMAHHLVLGMLYAALDRCTHPSVLVPRLSRQGQLWQLRVQATPRHDTPSPMLAECPTAFPPPMDALASAGTGVAGEAALQLVIGVAMLQSLARWANTGAQADADASGASSPSTSTSTGANGSVRAPSGRWSVDRIPRETALGVSARVEGEWVDALVMRYAVQPD